MRSFGAAFLGRNGTGQYADVFYGRVFELHRDRNVPVPEVLGHVVAHEIGHLLLGLDAHSISGIMRALWEAEELKAMERGRLVFSSQQSELMRARLIAISAKQNPKQAAESGSPALCDFQSVGYEDVFPMVCSPYFGNPTGYAPALDRIAIPVTPDQATVQE